MRFVHATCPLGKGCRTLPCKDFLNRSHRFLRVRIFFLDVPRALSQVTKKGNVR